MQVSPEDRFWNKVARRGPDECWLWVGGKGPGGYGRYRFEGRRTQAHRIAFELANGRQPYPFALHHCDVRLCCNPAHLWEGDHAANMRDMVAKGRGSRWRPPLRTHCIRGHEFTVENTYVYRTGGRACRTCCRVKDSRRYQATKARAEQVSA